MVSGIVEIINPTGLHTRPRESICQTGKRI